MDTQRDEQVLQEAVKAGSKGNMAVKKEKGSEGLHDTSSTFGKVYSDTATDAAGKGPQQAAQEKAERGPSVPVREGNTAPAADKGDSDEGNSNPANRGNPPTAGTSRRKK